jgi:hypothetical protein
MLPKLVIYLFLKDLSCHTFFHEFLNASNISQRSVLEKIKEVFSFVSSIVLVRIKVDAFVTIEYCLLNTLIFRKYECKHFLDAIN